MGYALDNRGLPDFAMLFKDVFHLCIPYSQISPKLVLKCHYAIPIASHSVRDLHARVVLIVFVYSEPLFCNPQILSK